MSEPERLVLRRLIDRAQRARLEPIAERFVGVFFCSGCRMPFDEWTPGCRTCGYRWWYWRKRGKVSEIRWRMENNRVQAMMFATSQANGAKSRNRKAPARTWAQNRTNLGMANGGRVLIVKGWQR